MIWPLVALFLVASAAPDYFHRFKRATARQQNFKLTTTTSYKPYSETRDKIAIRIGYSGNNTYSKETVLKRKSNSFKNGATDIFTFSIPHTGIDAGKRIELSNKGDDGWQMEKATLEDTDAGITWTYGYNIRIESPDASKIEIDPIQGKPTETKCLAFDDPKPPIWLNRAAYVSVNGDNFCWRITNQEDFSEASAANKCSEFPGGQMLDLSTKEVQTQFNALLKMQGAKSHWVYWRKGRMQKKGYCPGYKYGVGVTLVPCAAKLGYYCQYPGKGEPAGKATETKCLALDDPKAPVWNNRAGYVSVNGDNFCWRITNREDFSEASAANKCTEFLDGQMLDLSTKEVQTQFKSLIKKQGAESHWVYWRNGKKQKNGKCPAFKYDVGIIAARCTAKLGYYCQYPGEGKPTVSTGEVKPTVSAGEGQPADLGFQQRCEALSTGLYFRGSCFVFVKGPYISPAVELGGACSHMKEGGFLAMATGNTLFNKLRLFVYKTWGTPGGFCWVGLKQFDTSDEPKGGWYWHVPGIGKWEAKAEPITMWKGNPKAVATNYGGFYWQTTDQASYIVDKTASKATYLCQYDMAEKRFTQFSTNRQPSSTYVAADVHGVTVQEGCEKFCSRIPICRSFGYNTNTRQCYAYYVEAEDLVEQHDKTGFSIWARE